MLDAVHVQIDVEGGRRLDTVRLLRTFPNWKKRRASSRTGSVSSARRPKHPPSGGRSSGSTFNWTRTTNP